MLVSSKNDELNRSTKSRRVERSEPCSEPLLMKCGSGRMLSCLLESLQPTDRLPAECDGAI